MNPHRLETLESRMHLSVMSAAAAQLPGVRGSSAEYVDLNADGFPDSIGKLPTGWAVDLGRANGRFRPGSVPPELARRRSSASEWLVAGQWTSGDDTVDLALVSAGAAGVWLRVFSNDGRGRFTGLAGQRIVESGPADSTMQPSEVRTGSDGGSILLWESNTGLRAIRFGTRGRVIGNAQIADSVNLLGVADFNADGADEVVTTTSSAAAIPAIVSIGQRMPDMGWAFTTVLMGADAQRQPFAGDVDGDGRPDLTWVRDSTVVLARNQTPAGAAALVFDSPTDWAYANGWAIQSEDGVALIQGVGRFGENEPPALIIQTYDYHFDRIPYVTLSAYLVRAQGPDDARIWTTQSVGSDFNYLRAGDRSAVRRLAVDIGGDGLDDVVYQNTAYRTFATGANQTPTIGEITLGAIDPLTGTRSLSASEVRDADGAVWWTAFYFDSDGDGVLTGADSRIKRPVTTLPDGTRRISLLHDFFYGASGSKRFFARAWDTWGFGGEVESIDVVLPGAAIPQALTPATLPELTPQRRTVISTSNVTLPIATADFTGDGLADILQLATTQGGSHHRLMLLERLAPSAGNPGELRYAAAREIAGNALIHGVSAYSVVFGRFTSDASLDLALVRYRSDTAYEMVVLINDGRGGFTASDQRPVQRYYSLSTTYAPGGATERQEFLATNRDGEWVSLRLNDQGHVDRERLIIRDGPTFSYLNRGGADSIQAADLNTDGRDDLVVRWGATFHLLTSRENGTFAFSALTTINTPGLLTYRIGDVDGDGVPDLVAGGWTDQSYNPRIAESWVQVYHIRRQGGRIRVDAGREILRDQVDNPDIDELNLSILAIDDVTGDGKTDVAVELLTVGIDAIALRAVVIETPWSVTGLPPRPRVILHGDRPRGTYLWINSIFDMADVDGDGVLDLFRRDQALEVWRGA